MVKREGGCESEGGREEAVKYGSSKERGVCISNVDVHARCREIENVAVHVGPDKLAAEAYRGMLGYYIPCKPHIVSRLETTQQLQPAGNYPAAAAGW